MKVERSKEEMFERLKIHLNFLSIYNNNYKQSQDINWLGEVAGKLRLLVWKGGRNKPLFIKVLKAYEIEVTMDNGSTFDEYLNRQAILTTHEGVRYEFTNMELISFWAHQSGAAHEDWAIDKKFEALLKSADLEIFVGGVQATELTMLKFSNNVLKTGLNFIKHIEGKNA
jgi:hypothetical protein